MSEPAEGTFSLKSPCGVSYDFFFLIDEAKTSSWLTDGFSCYVGTTQKWVAAAMQLFSGAIMKDTSEGKPKQWGRTPGSAHGCTFYSEEEMATCVTTY